MTSDRLCDENIDVTFSGTLFFADCKRETNLNLISKSVDDDGFCVRPLSLLHLENSSPCRRH